MGLDITSYSNIKKLDCVFDADGEPIDPHTRESLDGDWIMARINPDFPDRAKDIEDGVYSYEKAMGFRAGSYGGYNQWREALAKMAGYPLTEYTDRFSGTRKEHAAGAWEVSEGPFWELIQFSDCEGVIGPAVCSKLAQDFAKFQPQADQMPKVLDGYWLTKYNEWRQAFELAAQNGIVDFH